MLMYLHAPGLALGAPMARLFRAQPRHVEPERLQVRQIDVVEDVECESESVSWLCRGCGKV